MLLKIIFITKRYNEKVTFEKKNTKLLKFRYVRKQNGTINIWIYFITYGSETISLLMIFEFIENILQTSDGFLIAEALQLF